MDTTSNTYSMKYFYMWLKQRLFIILILTLRCSTLVQNLMDKPVLIRSNGNLLVSYSLPNALNCTNVQHLKLDIYLMNNRWAKQ